MKSTFINRNNGLLGFIDIEGKTFSVSIHDTTEETDTYKNIDTVDTASLGDVVLACVSGTPGAYVFSGSETSERIILSQQIRVTNSEGLVDVEII